MKLNFSISIELASSKTAPQVQSQPAALLQAFDPHAIASPTPPHAYHPRPAVAPTPPPISPAPTPAPSPVERRSAEVHELHTAPKVAQVVHGAAHWHRAADNTAFAYVVEEILHDSPRAWRESTQPATRRHLKAVPMPSARSNPAPAPAAARPPQRNPTQKSQEAAKVDADVLASIRHAASLSSFLLPASKAPISPAAVHLHLDPAYRPAWFVRLVRWLAKVTSGLAINVSARLVELVKEVILRAMKAARTLWHKGVALYLRLRVQYQARRSKAAVIYLPHLDAAGNHIAPGTLVPTGEDRPPTTVYTSPQWNHVPRPSPVSASADHATSQIVRDVRHTSRGRGYVFVTRLTIFACGVLTAMVAGKLVNGNALQALHSNDSRGIAMTLIASAGHLRDRDLPAISLDLHKEVLQDMTPVTAPQLSLPAADKLAYLAPVVPPAAVETDVPAPSSTPKITDPIVVFGDTDLDISSPTSVWSQAGAEYHVDPLLLYSVALVETCTNLPDGSVAPTPWVVRIQGNLVEGSHTDVVNAINQARARGLTIQDVGVMQIYYPLHSQMEPDPIALLSPKRNVEVGAQILVAAMHETNDPIMGLGYYHSHDPRLAKYYGTAVNTVYHRLQQLMGRMPSQVAEVPKAKASFTVASSQ